MKQILKLTEYRVKKKKTKLLEGDHHRKCIIMKSAYFYKKRF